MAKQVIKRFLTKLSTIPVQLQPVGKRDSESSKKTRSSPNRDSNLHKAGPTKIKPEIEYPSEAETEMDKSKDSKINIVSLKFSVFTLVFIV